MDQRSSWALLRIRVPGVSTDSDEPCLLEVPVNGEWYARWTHPGKGKTALLRVEKDDLRFRRMPPVRSRLILLGETLPVDHFASPLQLDLSASVRVTKDDEDTIEGTLVGGFIRAGSLESTFGEDLAALKRLWGDTTAERRLDSILIGRTRLQFQLGEGQRVEHVRRLSDGRLWKMVRSPSKDPAKRLQEHLNTVKARCNAVGIGIVPGSSAGAIYQKVQEGTSVTTEFVRVGIALELPTGGGRRVRFSPRSLRVLDDAIELTSTDDVEDILTPPPPGGSSNVEAVTSIAWSAGAAPAVTALPDLYLTSRASASSPAVGASFWHLARLEVEETGPSHYARLPACWVHYRAESVPRTPTAVDTAEEPRLAALSDKFEVAAGGAGAWTVSIDVPDRAFPGVGRDRATLRLTGTDVTLVLRGARAHADTPPMVLLAESLAHPDHASPNRLVEEVLTLDRLRFHTADPGSLVPSHGVIAQVSMGGFDINIKAERGGIAAYAPARSALIDPVSATGPNLLARPSLNLVLASGQGTVTVTATEEKVDLGLGADHSGLWVRFVSAQGQPVRLIQSMNAGVATLAPSPGARLEQRTYTVEIGPLRLALDRDPNHGLVRLEPKVVRATTGNGCRVRVEDLVGGEVESVLALLPWAEWGPMPGAWLDDGRVRPHHRNLVLEHSELETSFVDRFSPEEVAAAGAMSVALPLDATVRAVRDRYTQASGNVLSNERPLKNWLPGVTIQDSDGTDLRSRVKYEPGTPFPGLKLRWQHGPEDAPLTVPDLTRSLAIGGAETPAPWMTYAVDVRNVPLDNPPVVRLSTPPLDLPKGQRLPMGQRLASGSGVPLLFDRHAVRAVAAMRQAGATTLLFASDRPDARPQLAEPGSAPAELALGAHHGTLRAADLTRAGTARLAAAALEPNDVASEAAVLLWTLGGAAAPTSLALSGAVAARKAIAVRLVPRAGNIAFVVAACDRADASGKSVFRWSSGDPATAPQGFPVAGGARALDVWAGSTTAAPLLATADASGRIALANLADGTAVVLPVSVTLDGCNAVAVTGTLAQPQVAAAAGETVTYWESPDNPAAPVWTLRLPASVTALRFLKLSRLSHVSNSGLTVLVIACADGRVRVYRTPLNDHSQAVRQVAVDAGGISALWCDSPPDDTDSARIFVGTTRGRIAEIDLDSGIVTPAEFGFAPAATLDNLGVVRALARTDAGADLSAATSGGRRAYRSTSGQDLVVMKSGDAVLADRTEVLVSCEALKVNASDGSLPEIRDGAAFHPGTCTVYSNITANPGSPLCVADRWPRLAGVPFFVTNLVALQLDDAGAVAKAVFDAVFLSPAELVGGAFAQDDVGYPDIVRRALAIDAVTRIRFEGGQATLEPRPGAKDSANVWELLPSGQVDDADDPGRLRGVLARLVAKLKLEAGVLSAEPVSADSRVLAFGRLWEVVTMPKTLRFSSTFQAVGPALVQTRFDLGGAENETALAIKTGPLITTVDATLDFDVPVRDGGFKLAARLSTRTVALKLVRDEDPPILTAFTLQQGPYWCFVLAPEAGGKSGAGALILWRRGDLDASPSTRQDDADKGLDMIVVQERHEATQAQLGSVELHGVQHTLELSFVFERSWWRKRTWSCSLAEGIALRIAGTKRLATPPPRWLVLEGETVEPFDAPAGAPVPADVTGLLGWEGLQAPVTVAVPSAAGLSAPASLAIRPRVYRKAPVKPRPSDRSTPDVVTPVNAGVTHSYRVCAADPDPLPEADSRADSPYVQLELGAAGLKLRLIDEDRVPVEPFLDEESLGRMPRLPRSVASLDHRTVLGTLIRFAALGASPKMDPGDVATLPADRAWLLAPIEEQSGRVAILEHDSWVEAQVGPDEDALRTECVLLLNRPPPKPAVTATPDGDAFVSLGSTTQRSPASEADAEFQARVRALITKSGAAGVVLVREIRGGRAGSYRFVDSPFYTERVDADTAPEGITDELAPPAVVLAVPAPAAAAPLTRSAAVGVPPGIDGRLRRPEELQRWALAPQARGSYAPVAPREPQDDPSCCLPNRQLAFERIRPAGPAAVVNGLPHIHLYEATAFREMLPLTHLPEVGRRHAAVHSHFLPPALEVRYAGDKPGGLLHHVLQSRVAVEDAGRWSYTCEPPLDVALRDPLQVKMENCITAGVELTQVEATALGDHALGLVRFKLKWDELLGRVRPRPSALQPTNFGVALKGDRLELQVQGSAGSPLDLLVRWNQDFYAVTDREQSVPGYVVPGQSQKFFKFPDVYLFSRLADIDAERGIRGGFGTVRPFVSVGSPAGRAHFHVALNPAGEKCIVRGDLNARWNGREQQYLSLVVADKPIVARIVEQGAAVLTFVDSAADEEPAAALTWTAGALSGAITAVVGGSPAVVTFGAGDRPADLARIVIAPAAHALAGEWTVRLRTADTFELLGDLKTDQDVGQIDFEWSMLPRLEDVFGAGGALRTANLVPATPGPVALTENLKELQLNVLWGGFVKPGATGEAKWAEALAFAVTKRWVFLEVGTQVPKLAALALEGGFQKTISFGDGASPDAGKVRVAGDDVVYEIADNIENVTVAMPPAAVPRPVHILLLKYLLGGPVVKTELTVQI